MKHVRALSFSLFLLSLFTPLLAYANTYTAASCNYSDVNAVVNGPKHTAINGDVIQIPAGTCTWTSSLSITAGITVTGSGTPNNTPSTFGAGTLNTILLDNTGSKPLITVNGLPQGQTATISLLDIEPVSSSTALMSPIQLAGVCNSNGCPQIRVDNIGFGLTTRWNEAGNSSSADWMIRTDNVFGVIDHNTLPSGSTVELMNANLSAYLGVGGYGDNSWAQPDTFGTSSVLYAENNVAYISQALGDCDVAPAGGEIGGCRVALRYNHVTIVPGGFALYIVHGLDTDGRPQSGRQQEAYGNTISCPTAGGSCNTAAIGYRGGTGLVFNNTVTTGTGTSINNFASITVYRNVLNDGGWGSCGGSSPYDTNDGVVYYSGKVVSAAGADSSGHNLTLTDSSQNFPNLAPNGAPYSVYDVTGGWWAEIASSTATSITISANIPETANSFNSGDSYQILRATVCADQAGRGIGNYVSGATPFPTSSLNQALDPIYEWGDTSTPDRPNANVAPNDTGRVMAYRDWYSDNSLGVSRQQTSSSSPFSCNGSTGGVGWGTLANRPSSCSGACTKYSPGCGYFATDQGAQGTLYAWESGAWVPYYQPYAYPHPLISGSTTGPNPASNLQANPAPTQ